MKTIKEIQYQTDYIQLSQDSKLMTEEQYAELLKKMVNVVRDLGYERCKQLKKEAEKIYFKSPK